MSTDVGFWLAPGLKVERVIKGSMADRAGLEHNVVIRRVGTIPIRDADDLIVLGRVDVNLRGKEPIEAIGNVAQVISAHLERSRETLDWL